jgi:hypothetical protein
MKIIRPIEVFSFIRVVQSALKQDEVDYDLDTILIKKMFDRSPDYIKNNCNRIASEIFSNRYTFLEFKIMTLYNLLFNKNSDIKNINFNSIKLIRKILTQKALEKDREMILSLKNDVPFDDISFLFRFNSDDVSFLYTFIQKGIISPMFWLRYYKDEYFKKNEFIETKQHKHFRNVMKLLKRVMIS